MTLREKTKTLLPNLILVVCSVAFALGAAEIALRIVGPAVPKTEEKAKTDWALVPERIWTEYHPDLGWYQQKSKTAELVTPYAHAHITTNAEGLRGTREYAPAKPAGTRRVVLLGDSFVFGFGVEDGETFAARLEAADPHLEALNFGVPGYGVDQMLVLYRKIASQYAADVVVVGIYQEDFWRATRAFADSGQAKPYFTLLPDGRLELHNSPVPPPYTLNRGQFPDVIQGGFLSHSRLYQVTERGLLRLGKNIHLVDPDTTREWVLGRAILSQLLREIKAGGATPVLMIVPGQSWAGSSRKDSLLKSLQRFAAREKVAFLDLTPAFHAAVASSSLTDYYIDHDWHWNAKGHALAAEQIRNFLDSLPTPEKSA